MSPNMKELLTDEVQDLLTSRIPVDAVISDGRRRLWRHRAAGGVGACAAVALAALTVQAVPFGGNDGGVAGTGEFVEGKVTYAKASTIHYGSEEIDVSPHRVWTFVQTDDGFVFAAESGDVYLADGATVEQIGDDIDDGLLVADDAGSYVAWVDGEGSDAEFVVYDTGDREELTRTPAELRQTDGVDFNDDAPYVEAVDGDIAYWRTGEGVVAWDLSTQSGDVLVAHEDQFHVHDVADRQIAQLWTAGADRPRHVLVSENPDANGPRFPFAERSDLSPSAVYLATGDLFTPSSGIYEVASGDDVTPTVRGYRAVTLTQWIDDDGFVARALPERGDQVDLLTCSVADDTCRLAVSSVGTADELRFPVGEHSPF